MGSIGGRFEHGKFRHDFPDRLADLLDDVSSALRARGALAIHYARLVSEPDTGRNPVDSVVYPNRDANALKELSHMYKAAWHSGQAILFGIHRLMPALDEQKDLWAGACISCRRDNGYWREAEPNRRLCRWCRREKSKNNGELPSMRLLRAHHNPTEGRELPIRDRGPIGMSNTPLMPYGAQGGTRGGYTRSRNLSPAQREELMNADDDAAD